MVHGMEVFKRYLGKYKEQYVFIGGIACDIVLSSKGISFRTTKDYDVVLIFEALNELFINDFCEFVHLGGYQHIKKGRNEN